MNALQDSAGTIPYAPDKYTTVLIVDADPDSRSHTAASVEQLGYTALTADSDEACIELFGTCMIELLLLDINEPKKTGLKVLSWLREHGISVPVIIITSSSDIEQAIFSMNLGAYAYLLRPVSINRLGVINPANKTRKYIILRVWKKSILEKSLTGSALYCATR
ncbi:response regulator [Chlorobaculum limnaeum]|uniref:response regulator n=1 Tax=Chlorobaculum limnaeum TaxID=274537 RepID=UPI001470F70E|nr:response regulator [Chlorobaculum limnaeum]